MNLWDLPETVKIGGTTYDIHADFRDILNIIRYLEDPEAPTWLRWQTAVALFYEQEIPLKDSMEAMEKMAEFIAYEKSKDRPGPKLIDWEQDVTAIISGVNKVSGLEVRSLPFYHWWSFVSAFHEMGEGRLNTIVSIRDKIKRGKKLEKWEQEFYQSNRGRVDLEQKYTQEELAQIEDVKKWIMG